MTRPPFEVGDVFRIYAALHSKTPGASEAQRLVAHALQQCRTAALGGHVERCGGCGHERIAYNSCRNRHCPKCQSLARACWIEARKEELLPVQYFHVVFTLPDTIAAVALQNQRVLYNMLFAAVTDTLLTIAADPRHLGAEIGFLAVLHTWGQNLSYHPHLHCVVPGGGLSADGCRWVHARRGFFLPVRVLSRRFRHMFLLAMKKAFEAGEINFHGDIQHLADSETFHTWLNGHRRQEWVVYSKRPFGGSQQVVDYLGRYTHRVAISNNRLVNVDEDEVAFRWRDYRNGSVERVMTLSPREFIRRFLMHVLPPRLHRIRYGGFLANCHRTEKLARCRELLPQCKTPRPATPLLDPVDWKARYELLTGEPIDLCPVCRKERMRVVLVLLPVRRVAAPRKDSS